MTMMRHSLGLFVIVIYLAVIVAAGFFSLFHFSFAGFFYPWDNFAMFANYSNRHHEIITQGTRRNGEVVMLPMKEIFPMQSVLVERGSGKGVSSVIKGLHGVAQERAVTELCAYLLRRYDHIVSDPSLKLRSVDIKLLSWPLAEGKQMASEELLTHCP